MGFGGCEICDQNRFCDYIFKGVKFDRVKEKVKIIKSGVDGATFWVL